MLYLAWKHLISSLEQELVCTADEEVFFSLILTDIIKSNKV